MITTYKGLIVKTGEGEGEGLFIVPKEGYVGSPFAEDFPTYKNVSVRFAINETGNWPETLDEVAAGELMQLEGEAKSEYYGRYSEITGYLWTEENCKVGGHDLMRVLYENLGKYLWMEVSYE